MRFPTTVLLGGKSATGLVVPPEIVTKLGAGKKPAVCVTIGNYTYRSTIAPRGDRFLIPLSAEHRSAAGLAAGDQVEVEIEIDTEPRVVEVPDDFTRALDANPAARVKFDAMSYSHKLAHVLAIEAAKAAETRQRRIAGAISTLTES
jgi:bifunctional DNA-binding transcriptional regulator/antitoxin component of YhaV-PrlF toxin-antitoxin module